MNQHASFKVLLSKYAHQLGMSEAEFMENILCQCTPEDGWSQKQLEYLYELDECLRFMRDWYDEPSEIWTWFLEQPISAFGGETPRNVFLGPSGPNKLKVYLAGINDGGFA
ncbi:hypothetical protein ACFO5Q_16850 [Kordiimonas lipolytica]|uniref:Antitoxin Xre/MbcA/ParS-like toxin-binding domain-containing protein n=1 Tax=Kordiimonas lipolytica TaxID=1662421 RepID=A0ABV8UFY1_9PROT|nr:hypothetical protein [Kordiimonas lipolytica]